jgi:AraC-like DNA-binding protein
MNQFTFHQGVSVELRLFPHIHEFSLNKNNTIQLNSFATAVSDTVRVYGIIDGKFDWIINGEQYTLYPGDVAVILPGREIGGSKGVLDIGTIFRLSIKVDEMHPDSGLRLGEWSSLSGSDCLTIGKILAPGNMPVLKTKDAIDILNNMRAEIKGQEIGYITRVNSFIDSLLITVARQSIRQADSHRDFSRTFMKLEQTLRRDLARQWTVEEMAALFGLGTTSFTDKVRKHTGFSPLNYLINIRISEAIKLLKRNGVNFTNIALETGFYSSQHFSTTFKKLTGYTPGQFRKKKSLV